MIVLSSVSSDDRSEYDGISSQDAERLEKLRANQLQLCAEVCFSLISARSHCSHFLFFQQIHSAFKFSCIHTKRSLVRPEAWDFFFHIPLFSHRWFVGKMNNNVLLAFCQRAHHDTRLCVCSFLPSVVSAYLRFFAQWEQSHIHLRLILCSLFLAPFPNNSMISGSKSAPRFTKCSRMTFVSHTL